MSSALEIEMPRPIEITMPLGIIYFRMSWTTEIIFHMIALFKGVQSLYSATKLKKKLFKHWILNIYMLIFFKHEYFMLFLGSLNGRLLPVDKRAYNSYSKDRELYTS